MILVTNHLETLRLFSGRVVARRIGGFRVRKILLALRLLGHLRVQKNRRVGVDVKRLNSRRRGRIHHAGRPRGSGSLLQEIDEMQIGCRTPLGVRTLVAGLRTFRRSRVRLLATRLGRLFVRTRASCLLRPFISSLFTSPVGLAVGDVDEPGWIQDVRADSVRFQRDLRR